MKCFPENSQGGQALVEFAILLPIIIFVIVALITVGFWMNAQIIVTQAAKIGAQEISFTNNTAIAVSAIHNQLSALPASEGAEITFNPASENDPKRHRGEYITVSVKYNLPIVFLNNMLSRTSNAFTFVQSKIVARIECDPDTATTGIYTCPPITD